ncbi:MAG: CTP synthase [Lachnospiraceae bacterium]|nr:CTP synthase [Lachnospiraceae bacterium]
MAVKYVFVTGGVVSGLGKGITAASLGRLLKARGYHVTSQKFDPYLNIDPGTMNPIQHGEVFVTDDGAETDLDLGHYERFIDEKLNKGSNVTSGKVYWAVLNKERHGDFGGHTVQVIPHITDEIKSRIYRNPDAKEDEVCIIEVGGTVGDIESQPFLEAIRQFQQEIAPNDSIMIHVTLIPYLKASGELKTKPTQASVKSLQAMGIRTDVLVCRSDYPLDNDIKEKISNFCNVPTENVIENLDVDVLYEVPLAMEKEHLADVVCKELNLANPTPDLSDWIDMVHSWKNPTRVVKVALVGKYTALHDAYISVVESLKHGAFSNGAQVEIKWVESETITPDTVAERLGDVTGIIVPGGFGDRGIDGMITAIKYARENKVPYLGLCLGMQLTIVEFARNVLGYADANSEEFDPSSNNQVIHILPSQNGITDLGGTLRLGAYPCVLASDSLAAKVYGTDQISERHRHRYEVNNDYRDELVSHGMKLAGLSPDGHIVEMIEIPDHPWFIGTQAHPEFKSRPNKPHPLFKGFTKAAMEEADRRAKKVPAEI